MIKFIIYDSAIGDILGRGLADENSFAAWPGSKLIVSDEIYDDKPELNYRVELDESGNPHAIKKEIA